MITVSNDYKNAIVQPRTIDAKITYGNSTITSDNLNTITRRFNSDLFKTIAKMVDIDSNTTIAKDTTINPQFGLYINSAFEYISLGSYKVKDAPILNKDTNSYQIIAYDKIVDSMVSYGLTSSDITYPCTVRQLFVAIFTKLGWSTSGIPNSFTNSTSSIEEDVYSNVDFTYRDVLDELCTISCMFLIDVNGTPTLKQKTTTSETINEDFMKDTSVQIKNQVFFNSLVFSRSANSDNIYRKDDTSITNNGLHEFKVSDLQILSLNWRDNFIDAMWNYIKTFNYYAFDIDTIGITYLEPIDTFTLSTFGSTYSTILLNSDLTIANGVNEKIYSTEPSESETEYKYADTTDKRINQTTLIVNKQQGEIEALVSQVENIEQDIQNPTSTKEGEYFDIEDALDEPLIDFSLYGNTTQASEPTPSSPQPIHNVSGDNTIEICGKNLFDINTNSLENRSSTRVRTTGYISLKAGTYTLSYTGADKSYYIYYDSNNTKIGESNWVNGTSTFTLSNDYKLVLVFGKTGDTNINASEVKDIQIEKSSTATSYEEYKEQTQLISLGVENIVNIDNIYSTSSALTKSWENGIATLTWTGAFSSYMEQNNSAYNPIQIFDSSKTYTISFKHKGNALYLRFDETATNVLETNNDNDYTTYSYTFTGLSELVIKFIRKDSTGTAYLKDVQIEKGSKANSYSPYGASYIELNKISTYQDYIYKDNDRWFLHKELNKVKINENVTISTRSDYIAQGRYEITNLPNGISGSAIDVGCISTHFRGVYETANGNCYIGASGTSKGKISLINTNYIRDVEGFQTWATNNNVTVVYQLKTPTDTEITDTTLLEQLNNLMTLPLYKNMTHITLTPNDLQPTMKIEYYRDTSINENFVSKEDMTKYYTKKETDAQIVINSSSIQQSVSEVQEATNSNTGAITTMSNQINTLQSSTSLQINAINEQLENGVTKVKTTTGYTLDGNGLSITKGQGFSSLTTDRYQKIEYNNKELSFMGFDDNLNKPISRIEELEARKITTGVHRTETIQEDGEYWTAQYYVGGGN